MMRIVTTRAIRVFCFGIIFVGLSFTRPVGAGSNAGGMLIVHDAGITFTDDGGGSWPSEAPTCESADNQLPIGTPPDALGYIWKVYAAFPHSAAPRLKALCFGASFPPSVTVLTGSVPSSADFELPTAGWPSISGYGVMISFGLVQTDTVVECYWLSGYGDGGTWKLIHHPVQTMMFVDDQMPPLEDQIMGLGSIGFGEPGVTYCPDGEQIGACCFDGGACEVLSDFECAAEGGAYRGTGYACEPDPCDFGACCLPSGQCFLVTPEDCVQVNGFYFGALSPCDPYPCPSSAPCCSAGVCYFTMTWICEQNGGIPYPDLDSCFPNPCEPGGACCLYDGTCRATTEAQCQAEQGVWHQGLSCIPYNPCVPMGACCLPNETCAELSAGECAAQQGSWIGPGSVCTPNPCPATPAQETTWGELKNRFRIAG